jgi:FlaG/FlaF family flagellin (archaellin)
MYCDTVDVTVDIDKNDIKLHVSGNWLSDVGSIFTVFFKGTIVDLINDGVETALTQALPAIIN